MYRCLRKHRTQKPSKVRVVAQRCNCRCVTLNVREEVAGGCLEMVDNACCAYGLAGMIESNIWSLNDGRSATNEDAD